MPENRTKISKNGMNEMRWCVNQIKSMELDVEEVNGQRKKIEKKLKKSIEDWFAPLKSS